MALRGGPIRSSESAETVPGWRVEDFQRLLTHFFSEGVVQGVGDELKVVERGAGANMSVDVGSGLALIEVTTTLLNPNATLKTWLHNDETINIPVPTADSTNARKDRIVAKFDMTVDPDGNAANIVSIELVQGTPAGSPVAPDTPSNADSLAIVDVPASCTAIESAQITDDRTFVTLDTAVLQDVGRVSDLASTADGKGANLIGVEDAETDFTGGTVEEVLHELQDNIDAINITPTGVVTMWTTDAAPAGWLLCYGQAVSRETYAPLFAVIGDTFGVGDGSTTFNLPDMRGRFPLGKDNMGGSSANRVTNTDADTLGGADGDETKDLAHTHTVSPPVETGTGSGRGAFTNKSTPITSSSNLSATQDIMPPYLTLNYIIKT